MNRRMFVQTVGAGFAGINSALSASEEEPRKARSNLEAHTPIVEVHPQMLFSTFRFVKGREYFRAPEDDCVELFRQVECSVGYRLKGEQKTRTQGFDGPMSYVMTNMTPGRTCAPDNHWFAAREVRWETLNGTQRDVEFIHNKFVLLAQSTDLDVDYTYDLRLGGSVSSSFQKSPDYRSGIAIAYPATACIGIWWARMIFKVRVYAEPWIPAEDTLFRVSLHGLYHKGGKEKHLGGFLYGFFDS